MKKQFELNLDDFCSGHLVVNKYREIVYCNEYISNLNGMSKESLLNTSISACFTKASNIFIDSYIYPLLLNDAKVEESQITWLSPNGEKIPAVLNIKAGQDGLSYWSLYVCANRDKLHNELIQAKDKLEEQSETLFLLATTDSLTGLLNRRELISQADRITHQVNRASSTYAVLSIDVDFFKGVNDTYGHQAGDKVLIDLAKLISEERRANDLVARIGGEEFVLLLPDIDSEHAYTFAEKLRKKIECQSLGGLQITVSIGIALSDKQNILSFDELLNLSDKALYAAKNSGRNKSILSSKD